MQTDRSPTQSSDRPTLTGAPGIRRPDTADASVGRAAKAVAPRPSTELSLGTSDACACLHPTPPRALEGVQIMSSNSFRAPAFLAALFIGAAAFPSSVSAQQGVTDDRGTSAGQVSPIPTSPPVDTAHLRSSSGPRMSPAGFTRAAGASLPGPARPLSDSSTGDNTNVAMMGVGAAAGGLGLISGGNGGTIVALSGGVVGLVGLYRYLR